MSTPLMIVAHPALSTSRINATRIAASWQAPSIAAHDLYGHDPDETINGQAEQHRQSSHERTNLPFAFHGDNRPPLLMDWPAGVAEHGRAYGHRADDLKGKSRGSAVSTELTPKVSRKDGRNGRAMSELTRPFEGRALRMNMRYLPSYLRYGASDIDAPPRVANPLAPCAHERQGERDSR
ncbi:NAD(P)H-dependent oxidoreductase [Lonsdalea quercina]|uniref:NAD(P)H-dependent oxidoreductase n=1 Tax=Lonsdalea quercina TaxID=71657 RepID=UPI003975BB8F